MPARLVANEGAEFSTTREGGVVAAKTLDLVGDMSEAAIVFDASHLAAPHEGPSERVLGLRLIAHELAHVIIDRTLHVAGAMADVVVPSITGTEVARSSGRILAGEYRADVLADVVVGQIVSMNVNGGEAQPYRHWGPDRDRYLGGIFALLEGAGERWPDTVQDYRERRIPLEQMWGAIVQMVDQTLTLIVHAQAGADVAEAREDVLALPAIAELAAARIYLAEPFAAFLTQLRRSPVLPTVAEAAEAEARVVAAGEAMNLEIYRRLGLTILEHGSRRWGLKVDAPLREPRDEFPG
jgi:hypothetical protein